MKLRKVYHRLLNSEKSQRSRSVLESESVLFLDELLHDSSSFYESAERYALSIIFTSTYGVRLKSVHNEVVAGLFRIWDILLKCKLSIFTEGMQLTSLIDFQPGTLILPDTFPILLRLPRWLQPWDILANRLIQTELKVHQSFIDRLKGLHNSGLAPDCYGTSLLKVDSRADA